MHWAPLQLFALVLIQFHATEFLLAWKYMRSELSLASCLVSLPYCWAMACAVAEYLVEDCFKPSLKAWWVTVLGIGMVAAGEVVRKSAMITAKGSFTHTLQLGDHPTNKLVTNGPYRYCRHPGYLGFLIWAVGTQLLLSNPICVVAFALVTWRFFQRRIAIEEQQLVLQFGDAYRDFAASVPTCIPFIP